MYNINRRKFLGLFGCGCCSLILPSCSTVPITERRQLSIIPEATINRNAAAAYEQFRSKAKLITSGSQLIKIKEKSFIQSIQSFKGLPHRFEIFYKKKNTTFINDSKATSFKATRLALASLNNVYWILGGLPKKKPKKISFYKGEE